MLNTLNIKSSKDVAKELYYSIKQNTQLIDTFLKEEKCINETEEGMEFLSTEASYESLGVPKEIVLGLFKIHKEVPSKIQETCIPVILSGCNSVFHSQSGSGKTIGFTVGILGRLLNKPGSQAIVVTPTRELNVQVASEIKALAENSSGATVYCQGVSDDKDVIDQSVIVGCPRALTFLFKQNKLNPDNIQIIVCDEADHLLSSKNFLIVTGQLLNMCKNAQKVFFSATYNEKTQNIIKKLCNDQVECNFTTNKLANNLKLYYVEVPRNITKKLELLNTLFKTLQLSALIVFCNSKKIVESVFSNLKNEGFPVSMIHGDATKDERDLVFNEFKKGSTKFLITTDLFSRGIDIPHVNLVINFDLPTDQFGTSEDIYNHRVGRTGRFNRPGFIIDFITGKEADRKSVV